MLVLSMLFCLEVFWSYFYFNIKEDKSTLDRQKQKNTRANRRDGQGQRSNREKAQRGQGSIQKNVRRNEKTHKVPI